MRPRCRAGNVGDQRARLGAQIVGQLQFDVLHVGRAQAGFQLDDSVVRNRLHAALSLTGSDLLKIAAAARVRKCRYGNAVDVTPALRWYIWARLLIAIGGPDCRGRRISITARIFLALRWRYIAHLWIVLEFSTVFPFEG